MRILILWIVMIFLCGACTSDSVSVTEENVVYGKIREVSTYKPISDAFVFVENVDRETHVYEDTSDGNGDYRIENVTLGLLEIRVQASGYKTVTAQTNHEGKTLRGFDLTPADSGAN